jgi:acyl CoA:acetate/3-ketoacid CoA transferase
MFSNFEGGTIDAASLGFLQVDPKGNVNPSMLPGKIYGPGGFPDLAGGAPRVYFAGAFTAGLSRIEVEGGRLNIVEDGGIPKFVRQLYKSLFSAREATKRGKEVLYITERAVFRLTSSGLTLEELAPGADLERDVLGKMEFGVEVNPKLEEMDSRLFANGRMGAKEMVSGILNR